MAHWATHPHRGTGAVDRRGPCWVQWVIGDDTYWVSAVAVAPADWRFAVFLDDDHFDAGGK